MKTYDFKLKKEYITLGQLIKVLSIVQTGGEVKLFLEDNKEKIFVNDINEYRRGKKLYKKDIVKINDIEIKIGD